MRFMSVVVAVLVATVLVATVAFSGNASAQARPITTTAYLQYRTPVKGPMYLGGSHVGRVLIVDVDLSRKAPGRWRIEVMGARSGMDEAPECIFESTDRALLFAFHQKILESLDRAMIIDCSGGTGDAPSMLINLDESPSPFVMRMGQPG